MSIWRRTSHSPPEPQRLHLFTQEETEAGACITWTVMQLEASGPRYPDRHVGSFACPSLSDLTQHTASPTLMQDAPGLAPIVTEEKVTSLACLISHKGALTFSFPLPPLGILGTFPGSWASVADCAA